MSFSIDLGAWNNVFAVPCCVVDKHIKLAGSAQLKVLLFLLRHAGENISIDDISASLSMSCADIKDAMQYWVETKLINMPNVLPTSSNSLHKAREDKNLIDSSPSKDNKLRELSKRKKPDSAFVAQRINDSDDINFLMQEAQVILSRPISSADCATLLTFHDSDGLPIDVILMLLQYAVSIGKVHINYIDKIARSWGIEEINTIEKAENKIRMLENSRQAWSIVEKTIGIEKRSPTTKESETANRWINVWKFPDELIKEAYDRCVDAKGKYILSYMDSIISRWHNSGIHTLKQASEEKQKNKSKFSNANHIPSYNINEYYETMDIFA